MRTGRVLMVGGVLASLIAGCATVKPQRAGVADHLQSAGYYKYWDAKLPLSEGDHVENGFLVDDNLYITTARGQMFCVSAQEGLLRWVKTLTEPDYTIYRPSHVQTEDGDGPLLVVTTTLTYVLDRYSGDQISVFRLPFAPGAGAVGRGNRLYFGGSDGRVYSLQWRHAFGHTPFQRWELMAGGAVTTTPVLFGRNQLIFASQGGLVVSCGALDKTYQWVKRTESAVVADPFVDESGVYVAGTDRSLYRFDLGTGAQHWRYRFPKPLSTPPVVVRQTCYQYCPGTGLTAIDVGTGEAKWVRPDGVAFAASGFGEAAILTQAGTIDVVDSLTGKTKRSFDAVDTSQIVCNIRDDRVILLSSGGLVTCARPESIPYLKRQQIRAARRVLTEGPAAKLQASDREPLPTGVSAAKNVDVFRSSHDAGR